VVIGDLPRKVRKKAVRLSSVAGTERRLIQIPIHVGREPITAARVARMNVGFLTLDC